MNCSVYSDLEAVQLLDDPGFLARWAALYDACPWATCYQAAPFVITWYRCYANRFDPVIVASERHGRLTGLFTLARERSTGALLVAGTHHAEYHVWLTAPDDRGEFIDSALRSLARAWPRALLRLLFLPPKSPLDWMANWSGQCALRPFRRPLMITQPAAAARESLRKKSNKSRLSRLQKEGDISFSRITDPMEFHAVLDQIADLCDFRQGGTNGVLPFHDDPHKKTFYRAMMEQPGLLHATVLRVGERIAAAHIGQCNKGYVVLGILAHSPFFARFSAGKLHLLMLSLWLEQDGFAALDLTPGGDFKDRFASEHDEAYALDIFFAPSAARTYYARRALIGFGKRFVETDRVKNALRSVQHKAALIRPSALPASLARRIRKFCYEHREYRVYRFPADAVAHSPATLMRRDCLHDLLLYSPVEAWQPSLGEFLHEAADRLEAAQHVYTCVRDGRLVHYGWLIERQHEAFISEVGQKLELPPESAVLYDFYTRPEFRGQGLYRHALAQMLHDAASVAGTTGIYIGVLKDNKPSCHVIESAGFQYQKSLFAARRLGRVKRW